MLVKIDKSLELKVPQQKVWALFRDVPQLVALLPGVEELRETRCEGVDEAYLARVTDKVGPFRLQLEVEIQVVGVVEPSLLDARLAGFDGGKKNRLKGSLRAELSAMDADHTRINVLSEIEVMGKLASLGASPIRRRADQRFNEFTKSIEQHLSGA